MSDKHVRDNPNTDETKRTKLRAQRARPTIGLLINASIGGVLEPQWSGVADKAQELGVNLICFAGNVLRTPLPFAGQANAVYDLASPENVDGLIIWTAGMNWYISHEEMASFCQRYHPLPIVSLEVPFEGIPSVLSDDSQGMRVAITHLIEVHDHRRIAFIRGPEGHPGAQERYRAYIEALAEHGIPLDDGLIVQGNFGRPSGAEAMRVLLEERKVKFEALASVNDWMAIGALDVLKARGLRTPEDVAIVNFDNSPVSGVTTPPLTVVAPPFYKMGQRAVETLLAHMAGQPVSEREYISPTLIVRQSCGCPSPEVVQATVKLVTGTGEASAASFMTRRRDILSEMASSFVGVASEQVRQLLDTFDAELKGKVSGVFVSTLERILHQVAAADGEVEACQGAVSALRRHVLPYLGNREERDRVENLWQQARVLIGEVALLTQARRRFQAEQQAGILREIGQSILTTFEMADLMNVLAQQLPQVGIPSCYLSLYDGKDMPLQWSRLMLAYGERGRAELEAGGRRFPSRQLVPGDLLPHERQCDMVVHPLYYRENQLGFVMFELGLRDGTVSETLRAQLSSSLNVILLWQEREAARIEREGLLADLERRRKELQTAAEVSRAASSIINLNELLPQTVELIRDRFNLYYVGLFLVEETGQYAVLRAGTGEAGRKMLEAGHRLEVGGSSMIGWCMANGQARIALDIGEEAVRFSNPLLPQTRSEMALPLISRGRAIGAMTIQSAQPAAFSQDDITTLQTMADQLANAIENAVLFDESKQARLLLDKRVRGLDCLNDIGRKLEEAVPIPDFLQWVTERIPPIMQYPDLCVVAIEYREQAYGAPEALTLPRQMVQGLRIGDELVGRVCIAYTEEHDFLDEESALLGDITRRVNGYIESQQLLSETQARAHREQILRQVTARVRGSTDPDTVMRTLARELGTALDRSTFVRLGSTEELSEPTTLQSQRPPVRGQAPSRLNPEQPARGNGERPGAEEGK